jgi:nucleoside-diphosphate-sugar epimerase
MLDENSHWIPGGHNSNYSISKYGAEREVWRGIAEGLPASMVNPSIIVGKTNWKTGSGRLFEQVYKEMPFYTNGSSGFVDVLDVVDAMMLLMDKNIIGERYIVNGGNIEYKYFFDRVAASLNKKSPQLKVPKWVSSIVWRLEMIRSLITNKAPFITKESAYAAHQMRSYSSEKLLNIGFAFRNIEETLSRTSKSFLIDIENAKSA